MSDDTTKGVREMVDAVYHAESRRIFATLVRVLRDFDLAEEALALTRQEPERRFLERRLAELKI